MVLLNEGRHEFDHLVLLRSWQFGDLFEYGFDFTGWFVKAFDLKPHLIRIDQLFNAYTIGFGHSRKDIGSGGLVTDFPVGNVLLWNVNDPGSLVLTESGSDAEFCKELALLWPGFRKWSSHNETIVSPDFRPP